MRIVIICDNCRNPKPTFEGKKYVIKLLKAIEVSKETFKIKRTHKNYGWRI